MGVSYRDLTTYSVFSIQFMIIRRSREWEKKRRHKTKDTSEMKLERE
jgi:hypothetical protein